MKRNWFGSEGPGGITFCQKELPKLFFGQAYFLI